MAMVTAILRKGQQPTLEQIAELEALKDRPIVFDEDCPPMMDELFAKLTRL